MLGAILLRSHHTKTSLGPCFQEGLGKCSLKVQGSLCCAFCFDEFALNPAVFDLL